MGGISAYLLGQFIEGAGENGFSVHSHAFSDVLFYLHHFLVGDAAMQVWLRGLLDKVIRVNAIMTATAIFVVLVSVVLTMLSSADAAVDLPYIFP